MNSSSQSPRSKVLWSLLFLVIAAATIWAVISQGRAFSLESFAEYVAGASKPWLAAAVAAMLGFIVFEGEAVIAVCHAFGHPASHRSGLAYAASDIYFSAITPSATGGQPACAYFMIKDGIPPMVTTIALLVNLTMYTAAILLLGVATLVLQPELFLAFGGLSRALIVLGYAVQILLAVLFLMLLFKGSLLHNICRKGLHLLCRLRLLKREEERQEKLARHMEEYEGYARIIADRKGMMARAFLFNLLQRASVIAVPLFVYLATGGALAGAGRFWAVQCYAVIGSNTIPIPGAMGVSDYIMLDGFGKLLPQQGVVNFELLSRSLSFYSCVLLCGAVTLAKYLLTRKRGRARAKGKV